MSLTASSVPLTPQQVLAQLLTVDASSLPAVIDAISGALNSRTVGESVLMARSFGEAQAALGIRRGPLSLFRYM